MAQETRLPVNAPSLKSGPYLAKIVSHLDSTNMGMLEVQLLREVGNDQDAKGQLHQVKYMTPFYGATNLEFNSKDPDDYNNTQKSYGMWMVPPDVGTTVVVIFIEGDARKGYWIGCVPDEKMNFMVPGYAATKYVVSGSKGDLASVERLPVAEYNKKNQKNYMDGNQFPKPMHPFAKVLKTQGLQLDDIRGITTSSARREAPSSVFGISTPGPVDKQPGAKTGSVGKAGSKASNAFVSRLGGSSFVMDDGDDKFLRKTKASVGPPEYVSIENGEKGGDPTLPHNELIRIRTRTGHQILMHNSEDLIYIGNASGTTWIELTSNGKIDIYAKDSVSIHTKNDLNVTSDRDINLSAANNVNILAGGNVNMTGSTTNINASGSHNESAGTINMNSGEAAQALKPARVPQAEPWGGHENLDPAQFNPSRTQAVSKDTNVADPSPAKFKKYTTSIDTFAKIDTKKE